ncbi:MAG: alpha/beta-hydrolase family protein [Ectothiorhodospiraceae bacterium]|nr:alpha/beta-hydrolase family protein [Ectothiorhodospiraceae bacterium]
MRLLKLFSASGLLLGTLFFAFSLTPSLLPRPFFVQGIISGLSFTAGYALGYAGRWLWSYLEFPLPGPRTERFVKLAASAVFLVIAVVFLWRASEWQNSVRRLMEMEEAGGVQPFGGAFIALLVFAFFVLVAWLFRRTFHFLSRRMERFVPRRVSFALGTAAALALFWSVIDGVIFTQTLRMADNTYRQLDVLMQDDVEPPDDPAHTGGAESLISWEDLGGRGRRFVTSGPSGEDIGAFHGEEAQDPIRVYVGLNAAETPQERARLALEELKRVGGFERSVLLLATPTGRGWVDPAAQNPVEYILRGDVATVAAQYSYLPSPLALIAEGEYGVETARALFEEIYGHWTTLPEDERPALYLHGLSLGALNSDRSFDLYDIIDDPFQGALWSGPPFRSDTWRQITSSRERGSPAWLPRFRDGTVVRFMNQEQGLNTLETDWGPFRIAYLQYASDPVTFFDPQAFYSEPAWMSGERGPDVSPDLRWFPVVTMLQLAADMMVMGTSPMGYGHVYAAEHYIDAWVALLEPQRWTDGDTERLKRLFPTERGK